MSTSSKLSIIKKCYNCEILEIRFGKKLLYCKGCGDACYCSKECQINHWKIHDIYCKDSIQKIPEKYLCVDHTSKICECMNEKEKYILEASSKGICTRMGCGKKVDTIRGITSCFSFNCEHNPFFSMMEFFCSLKCQSEEFKTCETKEITRERALEMDLTIFINKMQNKIE